MKFPTICGVWGERHPVLNEREVDYLSCLNEAFEGSNAAANYLKIYNHRLKGSTLRDAAAKAKVPTNSGGYQGWWHVTRVISKARSANEHLKIGVGLIALDLFKPLFHQRKIEDEIKSIETMIRSTEILQRRRKARLIELRRKIQK